jgi:N-acetylated-alpha-linked acidic dipeptidase
VWVERHIAELRRDAVAYMNVDVMTAGTLEAAGSQALAELIVATAEDVNDPVTGEPLATSWRKRQRDAWSKEWAGKPAAQRKPFAMAIGDLGGGSDFVAFLDRAGVPTLMFSMNGKGTYAVYHSAVDDFAYARAWGDKDFTYTPAFARAMGVVALRLAEAQALPFRYATYADRIDHWADTIVAANLDGEGNPKLPVDVTDLRREAAALREAARRVGEVQAAALLRGDERALARIDAALPAVERAFVDDAGLAGRPWYRHLLVAPGADTGYDAQPLPEVAEAMRAQDTAAVARALARVEAAIARATRVLEATITPR